MWYWFKLFLIVSKTQYFLLLIVVMIYPDINAVQMHPPLLRNFLTHRLLDTFCFLRYNLSDFRYCHRRGDQSYNRNYDLFYPESCFSHCINFFGHLRINFCFHFNFSFRFCSPLNISRLVKILLIIQSSAYSQINTAS